MSDTSTEAVMALLDGVTDGPWDWDGLLCVHGGQPPKGALHQYKCRICDVPATDAVTGLLTMKERNANACFIAAARDLVPALLAERDALAARVAELEAELASGSFYKEADIDALMDRANRAEAELPRAWEMGRDDAAKVEWWVGSDVSDLAPNTLSDWQRGFVAGQSAITVFIRTLTPPADLADRLKGGEV